MAKSRLTLLDELQAAIRSNGEGGLTTAAELRSFLNTLVDELIERTETASAIARYVGDVANNNLLIGGGSAATANVITGGTNGLILGGSECAISGGTHNSIINSANVTIPAPGCDHVTCLNCTAALSILAGTSHVTYVNDLLVTGSPVNPVQVPALMYWQASSLGTNAITTWPNMGTGGTDYDLVLISGTAPRPVVSRASPTKPAYVLFEAGAMQTISNVPAALQGTNSRTIGVLFAAAASRDNRNVVGYGQQQNNAVVDLVITSGNGMILPHVYATSYPVIGSENSSAWTYLLAEIRMTQDSAAGHVYLEQFLNGTLVGTATTDANTSASPFYVGGGAYAVLNVAAPALHLVAAYATPTALTGNEMARMRILMQG